MILSSMGQSEKESTGITHFQIDLLWDEILYSTVSLSVYRTVSVPAHGLQLSSSRWEKKPNVPASGFLL
jgi:hypothetical protein